ncbi:hypothetical protein, partial [Bacillus sp. MUM 116]|uniref:hypothetical protein n=1 Tax=Bacillus sp. MUM 116 TaxID=1678002 RepID=UPI001C42EC9F
ANVLTKRCHEASVIWVDELIRKTTIFAKIVLFFLLFITVFIILALLSFLVDFRSKQKSAEYQNAALT